MSKMELMFPVVLDASIMKEFIRCKARGAYKYFYGLTLHDENIHLHAGKVIHKGIEMARKAFFVDGENAETAEKIGRLALIAAYGPDRPMEIKNLDRCLEAYHAYMEKWELSAHQGIIPINLGVEKVFTFPIEGVIHPDTGEQLLYAGKRDMIGIDSGYEDPFDGGRERRLMVDEKTCKTIYQNWQAEYDLDWQFLGYMYYENEVENNKVEGVEIRKIAIGLKGFEPEKALKSAVITYKKELVQRWHFEMRAKAAEIVQLYRDIKQHGMIAAEQAFSTACNDFTGCDFKPKCAMRPEPEYKVIRWNPLEEH